MNDLSFFIPNCFRIYANEKPALFLEEQACKGASDIVSG
jgi:hypothetical protein